MSTTSIQLKKLWWVGPLTVLAAVLGVLIVRSIAMAILPPPYAPGLEMIIISIILTVILCTGAVFVFALVARFAKNLFAPISSSRPCFLSSVFYLILPLSLRPCLAQAGRIPSP